VLKDTTSRGLCRGVRVRPPHTIERAARGGGSDNVRGGCEPGGWRGGEGRARRSGQEERQRHIRRLRLIRIAAVLSWDFGRTVVGFRR